MASLFAGLTVSSFSKTFYSYSSYLTIYDLRNTARIAGIDGINVLDGIGKMDKNTYRRITIGLRFYYYCFSIYVLSSYVIPALFSWAKSPREKLEAWYPGEPPFATLVSSSFLNNFAVRHFLSILISFIT